MLQIYVDDHNTLGQIIREFIDYTEHLLENYVRWIIYTSYSLYNKTLSCFLEYDEFDFIVIGAGSAGCVVASRLSEIPEWKVLLLEAGTFRDDDLTGIPSMWNQDAFTKFNWGFSSVPQKYACLGKSAWSIYYVKLIHVSTARWHQFVLLKPYRYYTVAIFKYFWKIWKIWK